MLIHVILIVQNNKYIYFNFNDCQNNKLYYIKSSLLGNSKYDYTMPDWYIMSSTSDTDYVSCPVITCYTGDEIIISINKTQPAPTMNNDGKIAYHELNINGNITRYEPIDDYVEKDGSLKYFQSINKEYLDIFWDCSDGSTLIDFKVPNIDTNSIDIKLTSHTKYDEK